MITISFTYQAQALTLNVETGELLGDESAIVAVSAIIAKTLEEYEGAVVGGEPWMPFDGIDVTDPMRSPAQFSMCLFYGLLDTLDFPDELDQYLIYHEGQDVDEMHEDDIMIMY